IEQMAKVKSLVFDKTGTITSPKSQHIEFSGNLKREEQIIIATICRNSSHPLSIQIVNWLQVDRFSDNLKDFRELAGKGIEAQLSGKHVKIGSASFTGSPREKDAGSRVYVSIDGVSMGYFSILQPWREGLAPLISDLNNDFDIHLISGDQDKDRNALEKIFPAKQMHFNQTPREKLTYIQDTQK